jgi:hippurate hydrolase
MFRAGNADNVIPQTVQLRGTARSLAADVRDLLEKRLHVVVESTAAAHGARPSSLTSAATRCW